MLFVLQQLCMMNLAWWSSNRSCCWLSSQYSKVQSCSFKSLWLSLKPVLSQSLLAYPNRPCSAYCPGTSQGDVDLNLFCSTCSLGSQALSESLSRQYYRHVVCVPVCRLIPRAFISCRSTALSLMLSQVETCDWQQIGWESSLEAVLKLTSVMRK